MIKRWLRNILVWLLKDELADRRKDLELANGLEEIANLLQRHEDRLDSLDKGDLTSGEDSLVDRFNTLEDSVRELKADIKNLEG